MPDDQLGNLNVPQGYYKPIAQNGFNDLTGLSTKGLWTLILDDSLPADHEAGVLTEFCIVVTTNTEADVRRERERRRRLKDEALKVRMEAAIEKQNRGREF